MDNHPQHSQRELGGNWATTEDMNPLWDTLPSGFVLLKQMILQPLQATFLAVRTTKTNKQKQSSNTFSSCWSVKTSNFVKCVYLTWLICSLRSGIKVLPNQHWPFFETPPWLPYGDTASHLFVCFLFLFSKSPCTIAIPSVCYAILPSAEMTQRVYRTTHYETFPALWTAFTYWLSLNTKPFAKNGKCHCTWKNPLQWCVSCSLVTICYTNMVIRYHNKRKRPVIVVLIQ